MWSLPDHPRSISFSSVLRLRTWAERKVGLQAPHTLNSARKGTGTQEIWDAECQCAPHPSPHFQQGPCVLQGEGDLLSAEGIMGASSLFNHLKTLPGRPCDPYFSRKKQVEWPEDHSAKKGSAGAFWSQSPCSPHCNHCLPEAGGGYPKGTLRAPALMLTPPPQIRWHADISGLKFNLLFVLYGLQLSFL